MSNVVEVASPKLIIGLLIFIFLFHILATVNYWYWTFTWLDMPMHFLGGFWLAMVFLYFLSPKLQITNNQSLINLVLILSFVALIGVLWELWEFSYDFFISSYPQPLQQGMADTMGDLFFDLVGGLTAFVFYRICLVKKLFLG